MEVKEKILLVQLLLLDIRGNWGWENFGVGRFGRVNKAKELCKEISDELNDDRYLVLADSCDNYIKESLDGDNDGRYFRQEFPYGYECMYDLHGLEITYMDKSDEFKSVVETFITYPDSCFDDLYEMMY